MPLSGQDADVSLKKSCYFSSLVGVFRIYVIIQTTYVRVSIENWLFSIIVADILEFVLLSRQYISAIIEKLLAFRHYQGHFRSTHHYQVVFCHYQGG